MGNPAGTRIEGPGCKNPRLAAHVDLAIGRDVWSAVAGQLTA